MRCARCQTDLSDDADRAGVGITFREAPRFAGLLPPVRRTPTVEESHVAAARNDDPAFFPVQRPPLALLNVLDDGSDEQGELIRLRSSKYVLGRAEGDIRIVHDDGISGRHAELSRRMEDGVVRWYLKDLDSTNGTFIRVEKAALKHDQQLMIGRRVYRFEIVPPHAVGAIGASAEDLHRTTRVLAAVPSVNSASALPALIQVGGRDDQRKYPLIADETTVGRDSNRADVVLDGDPMVSPRHVRFRRDERGIWNAEDVDSRYGLWLRVREAPLYGDAEFMLGEQRFLLNMCRP
jgi:pSer/pThr/pTyr-binding forkhead associated (FHA) protein